MQYILQKYTLHTCYESTQSGPPIVCFHAYSQINQSFGKRKKVVKLNILKIHESCNDG
jgi:hypothetical protein